jgi:hypothetical protein
MRFPDLPPVIEPLGYDEKTTSFRPTSLDRVRLGMSRSCLKIGWHTHAEVAWMTVHKSRWNHLIIR